jgi:hypothetical protein
MLTLMGKLWQFVKDKIGRLTTAAGGLMSLADLDISPVKPALEDLFGHRGVQAITVALFVLSYLRHQHVASLHPTTPPA